MYARTRVGYLPPGIPVEDIEFALKSSIAIAEDKTLEPPQKTTGLSVAPLNPDGGMNI